MRARLRKGVEGSRNIPQDLMVAIGGVFLAASLHAAPPIVDSFAAVPPSVTPGATLTLEVEAHDPDCSGSCTTGCGQLLDADRTAWSANGGSYLGWDNGVDGSPYSATATWEAPATEGSYELRVDLSDNGGMLCGGRQSTFATVSVLVSSIPNAVPVIEQVSAAPGLVFPGGSSQLICLATDGDGDPISYSWSTDLGTVTPGTGAQVSFTSPQPGLAQVTCTADDGRLGIASATVNVTVSDAIPERQLLGGLGSPQRLDLDSMGVLYVVDRHLKGLLALHAETGEEVYHLAIPGLRTVAVDWGDDLLVGGVFGARILDRRGETLRELGGPGPLPDVYDVAADPERERYAVLSRTAGRVWVFEANGTRAGEFGATGSGPDELLGPTGIAVDSTGDWFVADRGNRRIQVFAGSDLSHLRSLGAPGTASLDLARIDDVEVGSDGHVLVSDSFQGHVISYRPDGSVYSLIGGYGEELGQLRNPAGLLESASWGRLVVASTSSSSLQIYRRQTSPGPLPSPVGGVAPGHLAFGLVPVGQPSAGLPVVLSNTGGAPLGVREIEVPPDFPVSHDCPSFLDPGQQCSLLVAFLPTVAGAQSGHLRIDTSDSPLAVSLEGFGEWVPTVDLVLARSDSLDPVTTSVQNEQTFHEIVLTNRGPLEATGVLVTDSWTLPAGTSILQVVPLGGSYSAGMWSVGSLPVGASASLTVELRVDPDTAPGMEIIQGSSQILTADQRLVATYDDAVTETTSILDGLAPTLLDLDVPGGTGRLLSCAASERSEIRSLEVSFSETLDDPPGDTTPGDVSNPASYRLFAAGPDGTLQSEGCAAAQGDDVEIGVESVLWSDSERIATLDLVGAAPLEAALHRFVACGELHDPSGNLLVSGASGPVVDSWLLFRSDPGNLFDNGALDCGLDRWVQVESNPDEIVHSEEDFQGSLHSGSAWFYRLVQGGELALGQCVEVVADAPYELTVRVRSDLSADSSTGLLKVCDFYAETGCDGSNAFSTRVDASLVRGGVGWQEDPWPLKIPDGAESALCFVAVEPTEGGTDLRLDHLVLRGSFELFSDGFESGTLSVWSGSAP